MIRPRRAEHEERLSLVEHLDELRSRIIISIAALACGVGLCLWKNGLLLDAANRPLPAGFEPITLSPAEPFMTTLTLALYGGLLLAMPVILYQAGAYVLPALTPSERSVALPLMLAMPVLFVAGAVFAYFVVVPAAVQFLLGFNADQFNTQIRAKEYYSFVVMSMVAVAVLFEIPLAILGATRLGIVTVEQLSGNRRYAVLIIAAVAMLLPGTDPLTMLLSMAPLIVLFEGSLILARLLARRDRVHRLRTTAADGVS